MNSLWEGHGGTVPPQRCALCRTPNNLDRIEPHADHRGISRATKTHLPMLDL